MSSFSSILASLGGDNLTGASATKPQAPPEQKPLKQTTNSVRPHTNNQDVSASLKRKAEDASNMPPGKAQRTGSASTPKPLMEKPGPMLSKPQPAGPNQLTTSPTAANSSAAVVATAQCGKPPPKGSFREILARAEATKAKQSAFGQIKHKPVEKQPKKERRRALAAGAKAGAHADAKTKTKTAMGSQSQHNSQKPALSHAQRKKPRDLGYAGTMRPSSSQPAYRGTMRPSSSAPGKTTGNGARPISASRYTYPSASEEDEDDYDDESDMEAAGFDELEEEEQQSLRAAKKEDEEALREEDEHRRQKAEKRKKLEELAAARRR